MNYRANNIAPNGFAFNLQTETHVEDILLENLILGDEEAMALLSACYSRVAATNSILTTGAR